MDAFGGHIVSACPAAQSSEARMYFIDPDVYDLILISTV